MMIDVRQVSHPEAVRGFDTEELRRNFLVERLFEPGKVLLTYSHIERFVIGGATPQSAPLKLESDKATIGSPNFLDRRELGVFNIGAPGKVEADGVTYELGHRDALYVAQGTKDVRFLSDDPDHPAKFYLLSTPAHARYETKVVKIADAKVRRKVIDLVKALAVEDD